MGKIANKVWLWLKIVLGTVLGLLVLVLIALRLILTPAFLTKAVNKYAAPLVDGELSFGQIDASVFSTFPNVKVSIDDALLTYPHDRFSRYDSLYVQSRYRERGRGEEADTLALFSNLSASVNLPALASGRIHVHEVLLVLGR